MTPKNHVHFEAKKLFGDVGKIVDAYCLKGKKMDIRYRKIRICGGKVWQEMN